MKLKYVVVFQRMPNNYCAYLPDLPGCVTTGKTWEHVQEMVREAVTGHIEVMLEYGDPLPGAEMSLKEAMAYQVELSQEADGETPTEDGCFAPVLSTTFEIIEFEVDLSQAGRAS